MAYCDAKTMDPKTHLLGVNEGFPTVANEVYQVLYHPSHTRYHIPDQMDSRGVGRPVCPLIGAVVIGYALPWPSHAVLTLPVNETVLSAE